MAGFTMEYTTTGASESVTLPLVTGHTYDCQVIWDGEAAVNVTAWDDADATHVQATAGTYQVEITGDCPAWSVNNTHSSKLQWTDIIYWGDAEDFDGFAYLVGGFYGCENIVSQGTGSIIAKAGLTSLNNLFVYCYGLATLNADIYNNCSNVTTAVQIHLTNTSLTTIPTGYFDGLVNVTNLVFACNGCYNLLTVSSGILRPLSSCLTFQNFFNGCLKLQMKSDIFYNDGEQSTRFLNQSVNFTNFYNLTSFTGTQGQAPDLWNCDFGIGTATKTGCFGGAGNSVTSLSNYKDIPYEWGGKSLWAVVTNNDGKVSNPFQVTIG